VTPRRRKGKRSKVSFGLRLANGTEKERRILRNRLKKCTNLEERKLTEAHTRILHLRVGDASEAVLLELDFARLLGERARHAAPRANAIRKNERRGTQEESENERG
jgi:hypothetical protein